MTASFWFFVGLLPKEGEAGRLSETEAMMEIDFGFLAANFDHPAAKYSIL
jgi:hypothetical protein